MGTEYDQAPKSGNKRGTMWEQQSGIKYPKVEQEAIKVEQNGVKNPKVETREDQSGTEWDREPKSGNKKGSHWE